MAEPNRTSPPGPSRQRTQPPAPTPRGRPRSRLGSPPGIATSASAAGAALDSPRFWAGGVLALIALAIGVFLALFRWNWLRGPIDAYASVELQRRVAIHGDLAVHPWSWRPSATAENVTIGEPAWAGSGDMATLPRLTVSADLKSLFTGRPVLPVVATEAPTITLIREASGRNNWTFGLAGQVGPQPLRLPRIGRLSIDNGRIAFRDARRKLTFAGAVSSNERIAGYGLGRFTMSGRGTIGGTPFTAEVLGGTLLAIDPDQPYPFTADIRSGPTRVVAEGDIAHPFDLSVVRATTHISGPDMADLYGLTGLTLPNSPPYNLAGEVSRDGPRIDVANIRGRIGSSDLSGHLRLQEINGRRDMTGALASRRLKLADLTAVIGGAPRALIKGATVSPRQQAEAARLTAEHRILPDARLDVARVRDMDADVRYRADTVDAGPLPVREVLVHARLDHGLLTLDPASLVLPQGALAGRLRLDARGATPQVAADISLARADIGELVAKTPEAGTVGGSLEGRARLAGAGASVRQVAADVNGVVAVAVPRGQLRRLFAELMGVDVGRSLFLYLAKDDKPTPVRCAVAEFRAEGGVLTAQRILIDTGEVQATGKGVIDLRNESLDLALNGKPKHFRLFRLAAPITIRGRLDGPKLGVDVGKSGGQLALGALLGAFVSPVAAIIPFVAAGGAKDADCHALLQEAALEGPPVAARG